MKTIGRSELAVVPFAAFNYYLAPDEPAIIAALINSVAPRAMIEFGCNTGTTARMLLQRVPTLERYVGIDVAFGHRPVLACQNSEVPAHPGHYAAKDPRFFLLLRSSLELEPADLEPCDAVFIDGDHSEKAVLHDTALARALLRPGGVIVWHDYQNPSVQVTRALDRLCRDGLELTHVEQTWLAFLKT